MANKKEESRVELNLFPHSRPLYLQGIVQRKLRWVKSGINQ
jgi:hypothetical protein